MILSADTIAPLGTRVRLRPDAMPHGDFGLIWPPDAARPIEPGTTALCALPDGHALFVARGRGADWFVFALREAVLNRRAIAAVIVTGDLAAPDDREQFWWGVRVAAYQNRCPILGVVMAADSIAVLSAAADGAPCTPVELGPDGVRFNLCTADVQAARAANPLLELLRL